MKTKLVAAQAAIAVVLCASNAAAINVVKDEEEHRSLDVGLLLQPQVQVTKDGAPDGSSASTDMFLRRARILIYGEAFKGLTFFVDTDQPNWGKNANWSTSTIIQDAFASYEIVRELNIDAGMMLVPFNHHTAEGAASLHALDYHANMIHYPTGVGPAFRDGGLQLRGYALGDHLAYRLGMFEGVRGPGVATNPAPAPGSPASVPVNPDGEPRFAASIRSNILGVEDKFFYKGIYFAKEPMLSIGVGVDYQRQATRTPAGTSGHTGLTADIFFEYPFSDDDEILAKCAAVHWGEGANVVTTGIGTFGEVGFRHEWLEPLVGLDYFKAEGGLQDYYGFKGGLNFWLKKHTANVKTEFTYSVDDRPTGHKRDLFGTVQGQLFF
jgi:hypothetical protein